MEWNGGRVSFVEGCKSVPCDVELIGVTTKKCEVVWSGMEGNKLVDGYRLEWSE